MKTADYRRQRFVACLNWVMQPSVEGGFANRPAHEDPGGATNYGITIGTLSDWLGRPATVEEVRNLPRETAEAIYLARYWNVARCDELPDGVDLCVFDLAVRGGPGRAARILQQAVGVPDDGAIGPITLEATRARTRTAQGVADLIDSYCNIEDRWDDGLANARHNPGWETRVEMKRSAAKAMAQASPPPPVVDAPAKTGAGTAGAGTVIVAGTAGVSWLSQWLPALQGIAAFLREYREEAIYIGVGFLVIGAGVLLIQRIRENHAEVPR